MCSSDLDTQGDLANTMGGYANQQRAFAVALEEAQTKFGEAILPSATSFLEFANSELLPILQNALAEAGPALTVAIEDALPEIKSTLETIGDFLPEAIDAGSQIASFFSDSFKADFGEGGIFGELPRVQQELEGFGEWLTKDFSEYANWDEYWRVTGDGFANWWDYTWDGVADTAINKSNELREHWRSGALQTLKELDAQTNEWIALGEHWGDGLAQGFRNKQVTVREAAALLAGEAIRRSAGVMGIESPSKVARQQGMYWGEGLELGLLGSIDRVRAASESVAHSIVEPSASSLDFDASGGRGGGAVSATTLNLNGVDPAAVYQLIRQDLGAKLAGL